MTTAGPARAAGAVLVAAAATATTAGAMARRPPGGVGRWRRMNYRGRPVELIGGPAAAVGVLAVAVPSAAASGPGPAVAVTVAAGLGLYDDLAGGTHARGLRGHLRALRHGQVTTGLVKLVGLTGGSLLAAALSGSEGLADRGAQRRPLDVVIDGALVAGSANLVNLLDLRPGRALKVSILAALPYAARRSSGRELAAAVVGAAVALLPADLDERQMVGDCGANALGAALGWVVARSSGRAGRCTALAAVVGLTLASERVSFSRVIAENPVLDTLDRLGRRPA